MEKNYHGMAQKDIHSCWPNFTIIIFAKLVEQVLISLSLTYLVSKVNSDGVGFEPTNVVRATSWFIRPTHFPACVNRPTFILQS